MVTLVADDKRLHVAGWHGDILRGGGLLLAEAHRGARAQAHRDHHGSCCDLDHDDLNVE